MSEDLRTTAGELKAQLTDIPDDAPLLILLDESVKQQLREQNPDWAYDMCCGKCTAGCYVDALTGA